MWAVRATVEEEASPVEAVERKLVLDPVREAVRADSVSESGVKVCERVLECECEC